MARDQHPASKVKRDPERLSIAFDYVDPGSYAAFLALGDPGRFRWQPLELRTPGSPSIDPRDAEWAQMTEAVLTEVRRSGVAARTPTHVPLTRKAHELACHAKEHDRFDRVHRALFEAHFEGERDIGRVDVLVQIAADAGLEPAEARTVLGVDRFGPDIADERRRLIETGIVGVPTIWSDQARIEGFRGVAAFRSELYETFHIRAT